jgi:GGDEF domain-containing protein
MLDDSTLYHDQLVSAAERALQAAKTAGGNCAVEERLGKSA